MADYIPSGEAAKIRWMWRLMAWLARDGAVHGLAHGFTIDEVCAYYFVVLQAKLAADSAAEKEGAARAAMVTKRYAIADALSLVRGSVKRLQANPAMTDADRADAGLTVPDPTKTATDPEYVRELPLAILVLDWSKPLQVILHWGTNPGDESNNARPANILGVQIQYHRGGVPEHESDWLTLEIDTRSPYIHVLHEDEPTTYAYRVCWMDKKGNKGPYCDAAICTVSV